MRKYLALVAAAGLALCAVACGSSATTAPSVVVQASYAITGTVLDATARPVATAVVAVLDGSRAGTTTHVDPEGVYRLFEMTGSPRLEVRAAGFSVATLQVGPLSANATANVTLQRDPSSISGRVTESAPTDSVPVGGASVEVVAGSQAGQKTVSAADGTFTLSGVTTAVDLLVRAAGYEDGRLQVDPAAGGDRADVRLMPAAKMMTRSVGTFDGPRRAPESFFVDVHHAGTITVSGLYFYYSFEPNNPPTRTVEIWNGTRLVASASTNKEAYSGIVLAARVDGGARYEIRVMGGQWSAVTMAWPN